ncbi:N-methyl-L-tryptophan oxidase [Ideonella sp. YS5]|uniref:N-methyl-L-tryptophan oxidase n=1 Tax=Ideonella sp. YS5 TaxID=3453714 RepID=UPI003EEDB267
MHTKLDVIVIGLGAMGSSAASHLAQRGARVLGIDRFTPPHAWGSSHGQTRIIREAYFEDPLYVPLVQQAYLLWRELEAQSGRTLLRQTGALMIGPQDGVLVRGARLSAERHGLAHEMLDADEVTRRFAVLRPEPGMVAVWEPRAGVLFAEACVEAQLALARAHGAQMSFGERVLRWQADGEGVKVETDRGCYRAGQLLITAGAWAGTLLPPEVLPVSVERQVFHWFEPAAQAPAFDISRCPVHLWEKSPSRYFYGLPDVGDGVKVGIHHEGRTTTADAVDREVHPAEIDEMRRLVRRFIPAADGPLRASSVCLYTNTPDGHFWIDRHSGHPQVLIASPCSGHGFKFASVLGLALARWLIDGEPGVDLSRFARR